MNKSVLWNDLTAEYRRLHPKSEKIHRDAMKRLVGGGSHNLRLFDPFPFYDVRSSGALVDDIDGNTYIDFWQGHFGNILGHNPPVVLNALKSYFASGLGLETGFPGEYQLELADIITESCATESIRFTTSGTLASMYAVMLSKSFTQRDMVLKIGGGWHGAQPYTLKGITEYRDGLKHMESAGLPKGLEASIITTRYNDVEDLKRRFEAHGEQIACLILEPFIGAGGFIFGEHSYLQSARELTEKYGSVLIFDEVISGFRFSAGPLYRMHGIQPDLVILGKAIGGGMPVSALSGKSELMQLCSRIAEPKNRVKCEGGTFSAHPACMLAGVTFLRHLRAKQSDIYPYIGALGKKVRAALPEIFARHGFHVECTGEAIDYVPHSSIIGLHFVPDGKQAPKSPDEVWNCQVNDYELREKHFKLAMLNRGFHIFHGFGAISRAHSSEHIQAALEAAEETANQWRSYR